MKLAIIADVHGNLPALEAVMEDAERQGAELWLVAGDHIGEGPWVGEILDVLRTLPGRIIRGNKERRFLDFLRGKHPDFRSSLQMQPVVWVAERISAGDRSFLEQMPEMLATEIPGGGHVRMFHGSPDRVDELIYPVTGWARASGLMKAYPESLLVGAHTHLPCEFRAEGKAFVNPGSVGVHMQNNPEASWVLAEFRRGEWSLSQRTVHYDHLRLARAFRDSGMLESGGILAELSMVSMTTGRNYFWDFLTHAFQMAFGEVRTSELIPNDIWEKAERSWKQKTGFVLQ